MSRRPRYLTFALLALVVGAIALGSFSWYMGGKLAAPATREIGGVPDSLVALLAPLLTLQLEPRLGISTDQLRPIDHVALLGAPLLLIHEQRNKGSTHADQRSEKRIRPRCRAKGILGSDRRRARLHRFACEEYEHRVSEFLARYLRPPRPQ